MENANEVNFIPPTLGKRLTLIVPVSCSAPWPTRATHPVFGAASSIQGPSDTAKETGRLILKYAANDGHGAVRIWCYRARLENGAPGWYVPLDDKKGGEADTDAVNPESAKTGAGTDPLADGLFEEAAELARKGWQVFPVKRNKEPLTKHGFLDATRDLNQIRAWWIQWPDANVAVRTGEHLDLGSFQAVQARLGELPPTRTVRTPSGGLHLWFQVPPKIDFRGSVGALAPGIDIRANGSYVVTPPSSGDYEKDGNRITGPWVWETDDEPALLPDEWRKAILALKTNKPKSKAAGEAPDTIPEFTRNVTLTSLAGSMRRRGMSQEAIEAALLVENREMPTALGRQRSPAHRGFYQQIRTRAEPLSAQRKQTSGGYRRRRRPSR